MKDFELDQRYSHLVSTFQDLVSTPYSGERNSICWQRDLQGDFSEIVEKIELTENITVIDEADLLLLELSEQGNKARELLINDLRLLQAQGAEPTLNVISHYERDDSFPFFPADVYSFHVDRSPVPTHTFLCTYFGASSEIVPNKQATQKILVPEIRAELKKLHQGTEAEFETFLSDYFFDLHYQAEKDAHLIHLGNGNMWKLAVDHPESAVLPCVHRAPLEKSGEKRLLLIC